MIFWEIRDTNPELGAAMAFVPTVERVRNSTAIKPLLSIDAISKHFGLRTTIQCLSFDIGFGQTIGVFGDRGSGKSNIVNILAGDIRPTTGHLWFDGEDITHMPAETRILRGIARAVPQDRLYCDLSASENVLLHGLQHHLPFYSRQGGKGYDEEAAELLDLVDLKPYADRPLTELSLAQRSLVSIATAMSGDPALLLLDNLMFSSAADWQKIRQVLNRITNRSISVLFTTTHLCPLMEVCDNIIVLHDGEIIAKGAPTGIVAEPVIMQGYLGYLQ